MMFRFVLVALVMIGAVDGFAAQVYESEGQKFQVELLTERDSVIWGFDFLSPEKIIFTERDGTIGTLDLKSKSVTEIKGVPKVWNNGQGGMLDIRVHPKSKNKIYFTYSDPIGDEATTTLAVATLSGSAFSDLKKLLSAVDPNDNDIHFGSRIEFDGKGHVFFTVGDRNERERAQRLQYHQGKILRLNEDGSVPKDNPFVGKGGGARPEIWSYGHRSPQGFAFHPATGDLWLAEMGPRGGDEINLIKPGLNYGWPIATYGREYHGPKIAEGTAPGVEPPVHYWVPSISPSGMNFYSGKVFPKWDGNMFLGNLSATHLRRVVLDGKKVVKEEVLLKDMNTRFRNVRSGPDGFLYFSTDDGKIGRLVAGK